MITKVTLAIGVLIALASLLSAVACAPLDPYGCDAREDLSADDRALADATVGAAYDEDLAIDGAIATLSVASGALPDGLALAQVDGAFRVRGTPTQSGAFDATLTETEYSTQCSGRTASFELHIDVIE